MTKAAAAKEWSLYAWADGSNRSYPEPQAGSLSFPGGTSSSSDGIVTITRAVGEPTNVGDAEFTIEMWIRPSATDADNGQTAVTEGANYSGTDGNIIWDADGFSTGVGFIIGLDNGMLYLSVNNSGSQRTEIGTTDLRDDAWHHIAVYRNASSGLMELFVDGNREGTVTGPTGDISYPGGGAATDDDNVIAKEKLNAGWGFNGSISEVRMSDNRRYNGATYTVPTAAFTADANTLGLWHFNEGSGTTANDSSTAGTQDGTLSGSPAPTWSADNPF